MSIENDKKKSFLIVKTINKILEILVCLSFLWGQNDKVYYSFYGVYRFYGVKTIKFITLEYKTYYSRVTFLRIEYKTLYFLFFRKKGAKPDVPRLREEFYDLSFSARINKYKI